MELMSMATRAELVAAARDLNKVLDLEPPIDVKQGAADLKAKILEANQLMREGDPVTDATKEVLAQLTAAGETEETGAGEGAEVTDEEVADDRVESTGDQDVATATKPKGTKAKAAKPKAAKKANGDATRARFSGDSTITVLAGENPKQKGSAAHERFELYKNGMTVDQFLAAGGLRADLSWDTRKGFVSIS